VLATRDPVRVRLTVDRRPLRSLVVTAGNRVALPLGVSGWHLVGVDVDRADRGLRVQVSRR
jgi:hypothetical protein